MRHIAGRLAGGRWMGVASRKSREQHYAALFRPLPNAVRGGKKRAFELYFGWSVLPPNAPVFVRSVSSTREEELAIAGRYHKRD